MGLIADIQDDLDRGAFRLIAEYRCRLMAEAVGLCKDVSAAEDLVSQTIDKAIRSIGSCKSEENLFAWMKSILTNLHLDDGKRGIRRKTQLMTDEELEELVGGSDETLEKIVQNSDHDALRAAIAELDEKYKKAVSMYYFSELSLKEIAALMNTSTSTVSRRLTLAQRILAAKLQTKLGKKPVAVVAALLLGIGTLFGAYQMGIVDAFALFVGVRQVDEMSKVGAVEEVQEMQPLTNNGTVEAPILASEQKGLRERSEASVEPDDGKVQVAAIFAQSVSGNEEQFDKSQTNKNVEGTMGHKVNCCLAAVACGLAAETVTAKTVTVESLLSEMLDPDVVTKYDPSFRGRLWSSHDRSSGNSDYANYVTIRTVDGVEERIMMDATGPGAIVRIWVANGVSGAKLRFYIDQDETFIEVALADLIGGASWAGFPLSACTSPNASNKGRNLYLPIPYAVSMKVAVVGQGSANFWYNIETRDYKSSTDVESFSLAVLERAASAIAAANESLMAQAMPQTVESQTVDSTLEPGATLSKTFSGPAAIRDFAVKISGASDPLRTVRIRLEFDGENTLEMSIGQFFGAGYASAPYTMLHLSSTTDGTLRSTRVMPFKTSATVTFINTGDGPAVISGGRIAIGNYGWVDGVSMHFGGLGREWKGISASTTAQWKNWVCLSGKGVLVGNHLSIDNSAANYNITQGWWGEGDERIFVDDEQAPSYQGTGTEDFFGYAYGPSVAYGNQPFVSLPIADSITTDGRRLAVMTRERALDVVPFSSSLQLDVEILHWQTAVMDYAPASFWYMLPGGRVVDSGSLKRDHHTAILDDPLCRKIAISSVERDSTGNPVAVILSLGNDSGVFDAEEVFAGYGKVSGGRVLGNWERVKKIADVDATTESLRCELPEGFGDEYSEIRFFVCGYRKIASSDYVSQDMLAHFDAVDNGGVDDHNETSKNWVNLADATRPLVYSSDAATFDEKGYLFARSKYFALSGDAKSWWSEQGNVWTWEAYVTADAWPDLACIMGNIHYVQQAPETGFFFGQVNSKGKELEFGFVNATIGYGCLTVPISDLSIGSGLHLAYVANNEIASVYVNGRLQKSEIGWLPELSETLPFWLGACYAGVRTFNGKIHAARIYNRALSSEEIKRNFQLDSARFAEDSSIGGYYGMTEVLSTNFFIERDGDPILFSRYVRVPLSVSRRAGISVCDIYVDINDSSTHLMSKCPVGPIDVIVAGLEPNTDYTLRFQAKSGSLVSGMTEAIKIKTLLETPDDFGTGRSVSIVKVRKSSSGARAKVEIGAGTGAKKWELFVAYGPTGGGNLIKEWAHVEKVADIPVSKTLVSYDLPDSWGTEDFVLRFFLVETDSERILPSGYELLDRISFLPPGAKLDVDMAPVGRMFELEYLTRAMLTSLGPVFSAGQGFRWLEIYKDPNAGNNLRYDYVAANNAEKMTSTGGAFPDGKDVFVGVNMKHKIICGVGDEYGITFDGESIGNGIGIRSNISTSIVLGKDPMGWQQYFVGDYFSAKFTDLATGEVVADMVPARASNGAVGLYDFKRQNFYPATGSAVAGTPISAGICTSSPSINWDYSYRVEGRGLMIFIR